MVGFFGCSLFFQNAVSHNTRTGVPAGPVIVDIALNYFESCPLIAPPGKSVVWTFT